MWRTVSLFLVVLFSPLLQPVAHGIVYYLPGAAETEGANDSFFSSTVFITNPGTQPADVVLRFIPNQNRPNPNLEILRNVPAGHTLRIDRALDTLFALNADTGTITLDSTRPIVAWMATSNVANPAGAYGLAIEAVPESGLLVGGAQVTQSIWASHSTDFSRAFRTNVGGVLVDPGSSVELRVFDAVGTQRGITTISSPQPASFQISLSSVLNAFDLPVGRVQVDVRQGRAAVYVSVVDNRTSDGIAVQPEVFGTARGDFILNGVARTPGQNNTHWTTDVRIGNLNPFPVEINISTIGFQSAGNAITRIVQPGHTLAINDIIGPAGFNLGDGPAGALRFSANLPFLVSGRTSNSDPAGVQPGSFSAYQSAVRYTADFLTPGGRRTLTGLEQSSRTRTNIGLLAGPEGAVVNLTLIDEVGSVFSTATIELEADEWRQEPLHRLFDLPAVNFLARVDLRVTSGSVDAYASKIDAGTGDPIVINAAPIP